MLPPHFQTITEQVAAYLRQELLQGRWSGEMAGQKHKKQGVRGLWISHPCHDASQIGFVASYARPKRTNLKCGLLQFNQPLAAFLRITHPFFGCTHITSMPHPEHPRDPLGSHQRLRRNPCGQHLFSG